MRKAKSWREMRGTGKREEEERARDCEREREREREGTGESEAGNETVLGQSWREEILTTQHFLSLSLS